MARCFGVDVGAETVKVAELTRHGRGLRWTGHWLAEHDKRPGEAVRDLLARAGWEGGTAAAATGRFARLLRLGRVPTGEAQAAGFRFLGKPEVATIVSIGSRGFSVLELRPNGASVMRENTRCSQGTGNFLRQLVRRFGLAIDEASAIAERVDDPVPLSGRCPVILKSDMTHLANRGEDRARILAGLFDAVCENVQVLLKPRVSPPQVMLAGGVSRSARVRAHFARFFAARGMQPIDAAQEEALFLEAVGSAVIAAEQGLSAPPLSDLLAPPEPFRFDELPPLSQSLRRVRRMAATPRRTDGRPEPLLLGFDVGSTGSKLVAMALDDGDPVFEAYVETRGDPVGAAQELMRAFLAGPCGGWPVVGCGATGSGREIVGSLLSTCYGKERVYVLNEIAAHAEGALHHDPRVDTIFEIGGQDAKYIRLDQGRVVDAAMNEACSAGTGSFIEEQGRRFPGVSDVAALGEAALGSPRGVSLGQHCSVFMAEVIDAAVAAGVEDAAVLAGLYDSVVQNYLNRVKGPRSVGDVVFCQGMPFASDALAAAVARHTGTPVVVPPNPGTVGAHGIALLARRVLPGRDAEPIAPRRFVAATLQARDQFVCRSTRGCGGAGNRCRIDRITTLVEARRQRFTWGGGCSLWDAGVGRTKLPDRAPDPFRGREELVAALAARLSVPRGGRTVALSDELQLKELFPFFATLLFELGFDLRIHRDPGQAALKRGIEAANVPFCAPMQQFHGLVGAMADEQPDFVFLPMLRSVGRRDGERRAVLCPIVQASPDLLRWDLGEPLRSRLVSPVVDVGEGSLDSPELLASCRALAGSLSAGRRWRVAYDRARAAQREFEERCLELGRTALGYAASHGLVPVVVLGRPYTVHNRVLGSNVPALLREQGALAIPVDCYPIEEGTPAFEDVYWAHSQRSLRAAHQIRRTAGVYSAWCSNYSCGPDSFALPLYAHAMQGRPFTVIETDGHSGDAGTRTRIEAFLHCVRQDRGRSGADGPANDLRILQAKARPADIERRGEVVLLPEVGGGIRLVAAVLAAAGLRVEALPSPDAETLRRGRRHTSGKECVPMCLTLGSLLQRLERERDGDARFVLFMPRTDGPCRLGVYNLLDKVVLQRLGWADRVRVWSPDDDDYADGLPRGVFALCLAVLIAYDALRAGLYDVRPVEASAGAAEAVFRGHCSELMACAGERGRERPSGRRALAEALTGRVFGLASILHRAGLAYAGVRSGREVPTVALVGEIYVRGEPFANDFAVEKLEARGLRARLAPPTEWLDYAEWFSWEQGLRRGMRDRLSGVALRRTQEVLYGAIAGALGWHGRTRVEESLAAAAPYVRPALYGEAVLTLGTAIREWRKGAVDGVLSVGPLECMPNKIAESQFFHVAERERLPSLTIPLNGEPMDTGALDSFAFAVHAAFRRRRQAAATA